MGEDFDHTMAGQFSMTETQMGTEMYQKMIEHNGAVTEHCKVMTEVTLNRAKQHLAFSSIGLVVSVMVFIPLYFMLWKVVLRW